MSVAISMDKFDAKWKIVFNKQSFVPNKHEEEKMPGQNCFMSLNRDDFL